MKNSSNRSLPLSIGFSDPKEEEILASLKAGRHFSLAKREQGPFEASRQVAVSLSSHLSLSRKSTRLKPNRVFHQGGLHFCDALIEQLILAPA